MIKRKPLREKGKLRLSYYFQEFKEGDRVAVVIELAMHQNLPKKLQGRAGIIEGKRGNCYIVKINDLDKEKRYIIHPVHLRKLK